MAATDLTAADLAVFAKLGISGELLDQARIRRVTDAEARVDFGFNSDGDNAGIVIPYYDPRMGIELPRACAVTILRSRSKTGKNNSRRRLSVRLWTNGTCIFLRAPRLNWTNRQ